MASYAVFMEDIRILGLQCINLVLEKLYLAYKFLLRSLLFFLQ